MDNVPRDINKTWIDPIPGGTGGLWMHLNEVSSYGRGKGVMGGVWMGLWSGGMLREWVVWEG